MLYAINIKGKVKDAITGEQLIGATVYIDGIKGGGAITGLDGSFSLRNIKKGEYKIVCTYVGYKQEKQLIKAMNNNELMINFALSPNDVKLIDIEIIGTKDRTSDRSTIETERNANTILNVIGAKAIELSPDLTVANVIQRMSGVTVERNENGDGQYAILRGMDKRYNYTLVNGVKIPSPDNKNRYVPLDIFPSELLDRLEVTKALTPDMEGDAIGGTVNMLMKDAPNHFLFSVNASMGYNSMFFNHKFDSYDYKEINSQSPYEINGDGYKASTNDFPKGTIRLKRNNVQPSMWAGIAIGNRFFDKRFGIIFAGSIQNSYRGNDGVIFSTALETKDVSNNTNVTDMSKRTYSEQQQRYGVHAKMDYKLGHGQKLMWFNSFMNMTSAQVRDQYTVWIPDNNSSNQTSFSTRFRYNNQSIFNSALRGEHTILEDILEFNWIASYSTARSAAPDNTTIGGTTYHQSTGDMTTASEATHRWEHNSDNDWSGYASLDWNPIVSNKELLKISAGGMYRKKKRNNFYANYTLEPWDDSKSEYEERVLVKGVDWNDYTEIKYRVKDGSGISDPLNYKAKENISAGYLQYRLQFKRLQIFGGVRVEKTDQGYSLLYPTSAAEPEGEQSYTDILPSVHLKFSPWKKQNFRLSYFRSINRPSFFEIVPYKNIYEDYSERGNPNLKHTVADNLDFRYEYFPSHSEQLMAGLFYKRIKNPIENGMYVEGQDASYMPQNYGTANNYGAEIDIVKYVHSFGIKGNYTYTKSNITTTKEQWQRSASGDKIVALIDQKRPLNGQSQHVANISLLYKDDKKGWDAQIAASYTGERIYSVSRYLNDDMWEKALVQFDASLEKRFKNGISIFIKANNLLNPHSQVFIKKPYSVTTLDYSMQTVGENILVKDNSYGRNFRIGIRYKL